MSFIEEEVLKADINETIEEFLERKLSADRKKILLLLDGIGSEDSVKIYKAGIYCFLQENLPAKQLIVSHCFNELINSLIRIEETVLKEQFTEAILNIDFVKNSGFSESKINEVCGAMFGHAKGLNNEKGKVIQLIKDLRPKIDDKQLEELANEILSKKGKIGKLRHFNKNLKEIDLLEFNKTIEAIEKVILSLESKYNERKKNYR